MELQIQLMQKVFWETLTCNLSTMIVGATDTRRGYFSGGTLGTLSNTSAVQQKQGLYIFNLTFNNTMALSFAINGSSNTIPQMDGQVYLLVGINGMGHHLLPLFRWSLLAIFVILKLQTNCCSWFGYRYRFM
jgi:hypothetical protein